MRRLYDLRIFFFVTPDTVLFAYLDNRIMCKIAISSKNDALFLGKSIAMRCATLPSAVAVAPLLVVASLGVDFPAEHVQAVAHVEHGIAVDAVEARVAASRGIDPSLVVALLSEEVVEVEGHDERLALEEGL